MPEASPASALGTFAIAIASSGMKAVPAPSPRISRAKNIAGK